MKWPVPSYYGHLNRGGHVRAISRHVGNQYFVRADLKSFYSQITRNRVTRELRRWYGYEGAREIAINSTVILPGTGTPVRALPFGFIQSPMLASICLNFSALGRLLGEFNQTTEISVTVYMDDIIISTTDFALAKDAYSRLLDRVSRSGFILNQEKTTGVVQAVEAFNIVVDSGKAKLSDNRMEQFRQALSAAPSQNQILGILGYVKSVNVEQHDYLQKLLEDNSGTTGA